VDATTGAVAANFDFVVGLTPVDPTYPNGGSLVIAATSVAGPTNSVRFKLSIPPTRITPTKSMAIPRSPRRQHHHELGFILFDEHELGRTAVFTDASRRSQHEPLHRFQQRDAQPVSSGKIGKGFSYVSFRVPGEKSRVP